MTALQIKPRKTKNNDVFQQFLRTELAEMRSGKGREIFLRK